jgi:hypothetical protein
MKAKTLLPLFLTLSLCAVAQQGLDPVPEPVTGSGKARVKGADPFLRTGLDPVPSQPPPKPYNIYGLVEYIEVPRDEWLAFSAAQPVGLDATALRAEVQSWITAGKAKPIELTCVATKSGQRMVVESLIERRFPSEFLMKPPTPVPSEFETRTTHFSFEWEPVADSDIVHSSFVPQISRLAGSTFNTPLQRKFAQPGDLGQPLFATQKTTISIPSQASRPVLLDAAVPFDDNGRLRDDVRWLLFFRVAPVLLTLPEKGFPKDRSFEIVEIGDGEARVKMKMNEKQVDDLLSSRSEDPKDVRLRAAVRSMVESREKNPFGNHPFMFEIERLEVTLADLNAWFADKDLEAGTNSLRKSALEWIRAGRGREVDRRLGPVSSKQRTVWESSFEVRYPTKYFTDPLIAPVTFETRKTGYTVEMEPLIGPDGKTIDLSIIPRDVRDCGSVVLHRSEVDGQMVPDVEQPVFATMQITTSLVTALGQYSLLGIMTPPDDKMQPDPQRRILTFVTCRQ